MSSATGTRPELPALSMSHWDETKTTLHLWLQIVGKVRMASTAPRNHWWHVPLYVDVRGLTTRRMHATGGVAFEIKFDFIDHRLVVSTSRGDVDSFALVDGLSVAEFVAQVHTILANRGIDVAIREEPYGVPISTPFPEDRDHASYDREAVERFWRVLEWTEGVLEEFAGWYCGKTSPVHLFWHGLDLAVTRFGGARTSAGAELGRIDQETYSHEVVSFGFWMGDENVREPSYYSYTFPEPAELRRQPLQPSAAAWSEQTGGSLALLPYDAVREATDPRTTLLASWRPRTGPVQDSPAGTRRRSPLRGAQARHSERDRRGARALALCLGETEHRRGGPSPGLTARSSRRRSSHERRPCPDRGQPLATRVAA